jgi:hypothetical protein
MKILNHDFKSIDENTKEYYDLILATLRAGVIGRNSEQNMLLIGERTVDACRYFEDEKYHTFFSTLNFVHSKNPQCVGIIEKSEEVKSALLKSGFKDIEGEYNDNNEIIGLIIFSEEKAGTIRAKKELSLDDSLKLLTASFVTAFVLHEIHQTVFSPEVVVALYYYTESALKEVYS